MTPKLSVAPMIDRTDRHFRYFCRLLTQQTLLYTEMLTTFAIVHGDRHQLLDFHPLERPLALQIAGCTPELVAEAVKIAEAWDYDEINLNVGCPSDRVSGNEMGAVLMAYPERVAEMVAAMKAVTKKPVTVKNRIGIDGKRVLPDDFGRPLLDRYEDLTHFVSTVAQAGADRFIIHARIAVLAGLSPKENREVPPLRYDDVYRLKEDFPQLGIVINGGIQTQDQIAEQLTRVDGVMIGRAAYDNPILLAAADKYFPGTAPSSITRREVLHRLISYVEEEESKGTPIRSLMAHLSGLFYGKKGCKTWRQMLAPPYEKGVSGVHILKNALFTLPEDALDEPLPYA